MPCGPAKIEPTSRWIINLPEINYNMAFSSATQLLSQSYRPNGFLAISDLYACRHHQCGAGTEPEGAGRFNGHRL